MFSLSVFEHVQSAGHGISSRPSSDKQTTNLRDENLDPETTLLLTVTDSNLRMLYSFVRTLSEDKALSHIASALPDYIAASIRPYLAQELLTAIQFVVGVDPTMYIDDAVMSSCVLQFLSVWHLVELRRVSRKWRQLCDQAIPRLQHAEFTPVSYPHAFKSRPRRDWRVQAVRKRCPSINTFTVFLDVPTSFGLSCGPPFTSRDLAALLNGMYDVNRIVLYGNNPVGS